MEENIMKYATPKMKKLYTEIQQKLFYMIPEKWDKLYLYSSVLDKPDKEGKTGELFFYYIPKGIFKKKAINVYEIPAKFNLDENQYLRLVQLLYAKIKQLREEFRKSERNEIWTNITLTIQGLKFKAIYDYTDLNHSDFSSYERHVIWRYEMLGIGEEQVSKEDKEILKRYCLGAKTLIRREHYDSGIYIRDIENMIAYSNENVNTQEIELEQLEEAKEKKQKNQLLLSKEEIEKMKNQ